MKRIEKIHIWQRDHYKCFYCNRRVYDYFPQFTGNRLPSNAATVDHIIPKSKGGEDIEANVITCCRRCNVLLADYNGTLKQKKEYVRNILNGTLNERVYKKAI